MAQQECNQAENRPRSRRPGVSSAVRAVPARSDRSAPNFQCRTSGQPHKGQAGASRPRSTVRPTCGESSRSPPPHRIRPSRRPRGL
jgi:hypothetical protein